MTSDADNSDAPLTKGDFEQLARFRFGLRRYLRFSETTVRAHGLTPQQYQLLLALKGFPGREWAAMKEVADRLQVRHHSAVELVDRAQKQGLIRRLPDPSDARVVRVELTDEGNSVLERLASMHRAELERLGPTLELPVFDRMSDIDHNDQ